jgi:hypothetical protein
MSNKYITRKCNKYIARKEHTLALIASAQNDQKAERNTSALVANLPQQRDETRRREERRS